MFRFPKFKNGYQYFVQQGKRISMHVRVAEKRYGNIPKEFHIHHIDGNKSNNRSNNLILLHKKDHSRIHRKKDLVIKRK
jgi:hypothetical protein